jgi:NTP pyrophosphatase (non-canonical NTP hydrolase)
MNFDEYQKLASTTAIYPRIGNNIYYPALALASESGEVCDKISKIMRDHNDIITDKAKLELEKELGDVLWNLSQLATELDLSLDEIAINNLRKLKSRKDRNKLHGSGDYR